MIADVADALHHAHERGFVHRDIKPSNILLDEHGKPFLADFGIAVTNQETQASSLGTLPYMAPEQLAEGKADVRSDIYSLGVVLYQLLTGRLPFDAADTDELRQKILTEPVVNGSGAPGELLAVCKKCLAKNPAERFASASDLSATLRDVLGRPQRNVWRAAQWAIGLLVILAVAGVGLAVRHFADQPVEQVVEPITTAKEPDGLLTKGVTPAADSWIDLAPLVKAGRHTQNGRWIVDGSSVEFGVGAKRTYVSIPVSIEGGYEIESKVTVTRATETLTFFLPITASKAIRIGIKGDNGNDQSQTATILFAGLKTPPQPLADPSLKVGTEYAVRFKVGVEAEQVSVDVIRDDAALFRWSGKADQITSSHIMRPGTIGLETGYYMTARFASLKLKPSGRTTPLTNTLFEARKFEEHKGRVTCLALSTNGKTFVTGSADRTVRLWNLETGDVKVMDQPAEVTAVALSSDGRTVASGCSTGVVRLLDVSGADPKELHSFTQQTTRITALTFSPQGKYLFAGSKDDTFLSWNLDADPPRVVPWPKTEGIPLTACFLPKTNTLAVGIGSEPDKPGRFWFWQVNEITGKVDPLVTPVIEGTSHVTAVAFSPDSSWVLTACHPTGVAVWKLKPGWKEIEAAGVYQGQVGGVNGIAISDNSLHAATAGTDGTVRFWTLRSQGEHHRFEGHTGPVQAVVFTPDRKHVLSAGDDGTVRMWRVAYGG